MNGASWWTLVELAIMFVPLSLVSIGGANTILPEVHRQVVGVYGWMTDGEFADFFALARAAPGPNVLLYSLVGWKVAGLLGALVATVALSGPSSLLAYATLRAWRRFYDASWRRSVQAGVTPLAVGLMFASAVTLVRAADTVPAAYAITAAVAALTLWTRVHPLVLMGAAAALAFTGWL
ncbi:MAG TPA: chromate transporter [Chloroflexota bacterium]|jgi:chromate transporter